MSNVAHLPVPKRPWKNFLLRRSSDGRPVVCYENVRLALVHDKRFRRYALAGDLQGCRRRLINFGFHTSKDNINWLISLAAREVQQLQPEQRS
ncbi:hypothetical protein GOL96_24965 [Sinorhizobium medicae]|uniref:Uncharacterized protein n=1 Tax=Sinorhizobium medicae TaxID=110321 RepID=A0ABX4TQY1_9HYPH|nr:hypothetical protein [Sinorhizobium medicae]MDX0598870.1 hypothetical protein [Sinorhizobium medicae]MDX0695066.1 hypothetical protein [Sinorhizobium medicae]MDX0744839.1 hypothetical protein [Sinorhizobium medicae]MDX0801711.1 hypothetical protein [Sinorhizobium medicae]MDX1194614.1 hypothetical protein [Sinorhizobium medicae]